MGIMEALEHLLSLDERPKRTFYIAFGHDEEVTGFQVNFHQFDTGEFQLDKYFTVQSSSEFRTSPVSNN